MTKIRVRYEVLCEDEATAQRVLSEYMPSHDGMAGLPGILSVGVVWTADNVDNVVDREQRLRMTKGEAEKFYGGPMPEQMR